LLERSIHHHINDDDGGGGLIQYAFRIAFSSSYSATARHQSSFSFSTMMAGYLGL
jgi:hypothetical protein